jgi:hypothetical protein
MDARLLSRLQIGKSRDIVEPITLFKSPKPNLNQGTQLVINSSMRNYSDFPEESSFTINLANPLTNVSSVKLIALDIPKTAYTIDSTNDCFWFSEENTLFLARLPWGFFNAMDLCDVLNTSITCAIGYFNSVTPVQNNYLFTYDSVHSNKICFEAINNNVIPFTIHCPGATNLDITQVEFNGSLIVLTTRCKSHGISTGDVVKNCDVQATDSKKWLTLSNIPVSFADPNSNTLTVTTPSNGFTWPYSSNSIVVNKSYFSTVSMHSCASKQLGFSSSMALGTRTRILSSTTDTLFCRFPHFLKLGDTFQVESSCPASQPASQANPASPASPDSPASPAVFTVTEVPNDFSVRFEAQAQALRIPSFLVKKINMVETQRISQNKVDLYSQTKNLLLRCTLNNIDIGNIATPVEATRYFSRIQMREDYVFNNSKTDIGERFCLTQPIPRLLQIKLQLVNESTRQICKLHGPGWSIMLHFTCDES